MDAKASTPSPSKKLLHGTKLFSPVRGDKQDITSPIHSLQVTMKTNLWQSLSTKHRTKSLTHQTAPHTPLAAHRWSKWSKRSSGAPPPHRYDKIVNSLISHRTRHNLWPQTALNTIMQVSASASTVTALIVT